MILELKQRDEEPDEIMVNGIKFLVKIWPSVNNTTITFLKGSTPDYFWKIDESDQANVTMFNMCDKQQLMKDMAETYTLVRMAGDYYLTDLKRSQVWKNGIYLHATYVVNHDELSHTETR